MMMRSNPAIHMMRASAGHRIASRNKVTLLDHAQAKERQLVNHVAKDSTMTVACSPYPIKCQDRIDCITKGMNYQLPCYPMYYIPWGVTWFASGAQSPNAYGLSLYSNGLAVLTANGFVVDPQALVQILLPDLGYAGSTQPRSGDMWGLSGYTGPDPGPSANSIYVVIDDQQPGRWVLSRLSTRFYPRGAYLQVMHMIGPFENNVPRLVTLTNIVCPNNTWEWEGTSIGLVVLVCMIYIKTKLHRCKCRCRKRLCRGLPSCQRRAWVTDRHMINVSRK